MSFSVKPLVADDNKKNEGSRIKNILFILLFVVMSGMYLSYCFSIQTFFNNTKLKAEADEIVINFVGIWL